MSQGWSATFCATGTWGGKPIGRVRVNEWYEMCHRRHHKMCFTIIVSNSYTNSLKFAFPIFFNSFRPLSDQVQRHCSHRWFLYGILIFKNWPRLVSMSLPNAALIGPNKFIKKIITAYPFITSTLKKLKTRKSKFKKILLSNILKINFWTSGHNFLGVWFEYFWLKIYLIKTSAQLIKGIG